MEHLIDRIRDTLQHAQSCYQPSLAVAIMPVRLQTGCATEGKPDAIPVSLPCIDQRSLPTPQPIPLTIFH
jgi:hypothetical protein